MQELQASGTFTNLDKLKSLMAVARKDVVLSSGWDEDMIQRMGALASGGRNGKRVEFRTLPVVRYDNIDGQDVNIIDPAAIKAEVAAAIGASPPTTHARHHGRQTQSIHRRRRDQCRQHERARHRGIPRPEKARLHHGSNPRPQFG